MALWGSKKMDRWQQKVKRRTHGVGSAKVNTSTVQKIHKKWDSQTLFLMFTIGTSFF